MRKNAEVGRVLALVGISCALSGAAWAQTDVIKTSRGDLRITPIFHGSLMLQFGGKAIYVDPVNRGNYAGKADLILVTHEHGDHMNISRLGMLRTPKTIVIGPEDVTAARAVYDGQTMHNGEKKSFADIEVEAVPMYNLTRGRKPGELFHSKGPGNGYILTLGDKRLYVSGDTECIPEMKALKNIDVAFISMNPPHTMTPGEAAECVNAFKPKIVYPYHYGKTNLQEFANAVQGTPGVEVRLREWYKD